MTSTNYGLNFAPIQLTGQTRTQELYVNNLRVISDPDDYSTLNLSDIGGNTAIFSNLSILGNGIIGGNLDVGGNLKVDLGIEAPVIVVPLAAVQVLTSVNADLTNITCSNITVSNSFVANGNATFNSNISINGNLTHTGNLVLTGNLSVSGNRTTINSNTTIVGNTLINTFVNIQPDGQLFARNGIDTSGLFTVRNQLNPADYLQINPQADSVYIGGSNIVIDGQTNNHTFTVDGFSSISLNDPTNPIQLVNTTPASTANKLYNVNGRLYFNGNVLEQGNIAGNYVPIIQQVSNDISKYQTCVSYYLDFTPIPNNGTFLYYSSVPYPSFSDLPSFLYLSNASSATKSLQLYDVSSQRTVGKLDGFHLTVFNNSAHHIAVYFSDKTNPTFNIWDGTTLVTHVDIDIDECIVFVYQQSFNYFFVASRSVNLENYNIKFNNFESIGTFSGTTITATTTTSTNLNSTSFATTTANISGNMRVGNIGAFTHPNIGVNANLLFEEGHIVVSNATPTQDAQLTNKRYVDSREAVFRSNLLANNNAWSGTNQFNNAVSLVDTSIIVKNATTTKYIQVFQDTAYTNNTAGTGYTIDGQSNTGDFIVQNFSSLRVNNPLKVNDIKPVSSTLTIGGDNGLSTLNLATSDSTQTINIGTGTGITTINVGQPTDIINLNGNVQYTQVQDLVVTNKDIQLNANAVGSGTARGAGILIRDNNSDTAGKFIVNNAGTGYNLKAPEEAREINLDLSNFGNGVLSVSANTVTSGNLTQTLNFTGGNPYIRFNSQKNADLSQYDVWRNGIGNIMNYVGIDGDGFTELGSNAFTFATTNATGSSFRFKTNNLATTRLEIENSGNIRLPQMTASKPLSLDANKNIISGDLSQSVITNLTSDLATKANLSGATFTGTVGVRATTNLQGSLYTGEATFNTVPVQLRVEDDSQNIQDVWETRQQYSVSGSTTLNPTNKNIKMSYSRLNNSAQTNPFTDDLKYIEYAYQSTANGGTRLHTPTLQTYTLQSPSPSANISANGNINLITNRFIECPSAPITGTHLTNKTYVDNLFASNIVNLNNVFTGNNTFNGATTTIGSSSKLVVNNVESSNPSNLNVQINSNTAFINNRIVQIDPLAETGLVIFGGNIAPAGANPTTISGADSFGISQVKSGSSDAGVYLQTWNSRVLYLNSLGGNDVTVGSQGGSTVNLNCWNNIRAYNKSNGGQYIQSYINTSDSNRGYVESVGTHMTLSGSPSNTYNLRVSNFTDTTFQGTSSRNINLYPTSLGSSTNIYGNTSSNNLNVGWNDFGSFIQSYGSPLLINAGAGAGITIGSQTATPQTMNVYANTTYYQSNNTSTNINIDMPNTRFLIGDHDWAITGKVNRKLQITGFTTTFFQSNVNVFENAVGGTNTSCLIWTGLVDATNANPSGIASVNSFTISGDASFTYLQSWNSRPLRINQLGNGVAFGSSGAPIGLSQYGTYTIYSPLTNNNYFQFGFQVAYTGTNNYTIDGQGQGYSFNFQGYANYFVGAAWQVPSDRRRKKNITDVDEEEAVSIVKKLRPVNYEYTHKNSSKYIGFVAQEVEEVLPQAVSTMEDEEQSKALDYNSIFALQTKVIQNLLKRIEQLEALKNSGRDFS